MSPDIDLNFYHDDYVQKIGVRGQYFVQGRMDNKSYSSELDVWIGRETANFFNDERALTNAMNAPEIRGFRDLHEAVGVSNRKNVSSPENLLATAIRIKRLPRINPIVDIYNVWSIKTLLALGAHDVSSIIGSVSLRRTDGSEKFVPLGLSDTKPIQANEYGYVDSSNEIICRLETRQVEKTKVTADTSDCFFIIQGNLLTPRSAIEECFVNLTESLSRFCRAGEPRIVGIV